MSTTTRSKNSVTKFVLSSFFFLLTVSVQNARPEDFGYGMDAGSLTNNCQLDSVLQSLLTPDELASIHVQALRQELLRILNNEALNEHAEIPDYDLLSDGKLGYDESATMEDKRSIAALAKSGQFPYELKRNLGALARAGLLRNYNKRSIATLAKNGQLPTLQSPEETEVDDEEQKRSIASLARAGAMNRYLKKSIESLARSGYMTGKRNIGALARNGYLKRDMNDYLEDLYQKRYIGSLAKQYNFPSGKRNLGSLARNGELMRYNRNNADDAIFDSDKRNVQSLMKSGGLGGGKRNLASLARSQSMPFYGKYEVYKRNIGAIARDWALPNHSTGWEKNGDDKRNVAALLRQDSYLHSMNSHSIAHPTPEMDDEIQTEDKRNLASLKAQATSNYINYGNRNVKRSVTENQGGVENSAKSNDDKAHPRTKRQSDDYFEGSSDEYPVPVMQNSNSVDYEELINALTGKYPANDKRFLGSVARGGWFRAGSGPGQVRFNPIKRHIGSLARLGWLPSFRYARSRFHRSGRSSTESESHTREYSPLTDGRIRQVFDDGPISNIEYNTDEPHIPQTPIPSLQNQLSRQRINDQDLSSSSPNALAIVFSDRSYKIPNEFSDSNPEDDPDSYEPEVNFIKRYLLLPAVDNILLRRLYPSYTTAIKSKTS